jgi:hypothetical protein
MGSNPTGVVIACLWLLSQPEWRDSSGGNIDVPVGGEGGPIAARESTARRPAPHIVARTETSATPAPGRKASARRAAASAAKGRDEHCVFCCSGAFAFAAEWRGG